MPVDAATPPVGQSGVAMLATQPQTQQLADGVAAAMFGAIPPEGLPSTMGVSNTLGAPSGFGPQPNETQNILQIALVANAGKKRKRVDQDDAELNFPTETVCMTPAKQPRLEAPSASSNDDLLQSAFPADVQRGMNPLFEQPSA